MTEIPIGLFDSGVGGLSILREVNARLPDQDLIFLADQAHVPYGPRPLGQVRDFAEGIARFLIDQGAQLIVVACNTASAAALRHLRQTLPDTPFVGMEPAVKPAVEQTTSGVVGVLATPATFQGELYASVVERFAGNVQIVPAILPGLVECIEAGDLEGPTPRQILQRAITPLLDRGADTLVLACTHYPFVIPLIRQIAGPGVRVIDPSPAIARQTERLVQQHGLAASGGRKGIITLLSTGGPEDLTRQANELLGWRGKALGVRWGGSLLRGVE
jgi:glutamate racemase